MSVITAIPWSRVNDKWIRSSRIDATPVKDSVTHPLVSLPYDMYLPTQNFNFYKNVALDIVTETAYHYPHAKITEKTLRPIVYKRMFIVLGPPNILKTLQDKGFKTFNNFINEKYDSIQDPEERFLTVIHEIEKFCQRDLNEIKKYYQDNKNIFEHNYNRLLELREEEMDQLRSTL